MKGILSVFCAQAGAKKVYAVEASEAVIETLQQVISDNNCQRIVEVIHGKVESVEIPEPVDIIISEWMGLYLLNEGMLESVIYARQFLSSNGIMIPSKATIYMALCDMPELVRSWHTVNGVNLYSAALKYRKESAMFPVFDVIKPEDLLSSAQIFQTFDLLSTRKEDLELLSKEAVFVPRRRGIVEGVVFWFSVQLCGNVSLTTSPEAPPTHWKQTIVLLPKAELVDEETLVEMNIVFKKISQRCYDILLTPLGIEENTPQ